MIKIIKRLFGLDELERKVNMLYRWMEKEVYKELIKPVKKRIL
jgi:hypothetical protein